MWWTNRKICMIRHIWPPSTLPVCWENIKITLARSKVADERDLKITKSWLPRKFKKEHYSSRSKKNKTRFMRPKKWTLFTRKERLFNLEIWELEKFIFFSYSCQPQNIVKFHFEVSLFLFGSHSSISSMIMMLSWVNFSIFTIFSELSLLIQVERDRKVCLSKKFTVKGARMSKFVVCGDDSFFFFFR